jgi:hypothetical protein
MMQPIIKAREPQCPAATVTDTLICNQQVYAQVHICRPVCY